MDLKIRESCFCIQKHDKFDSNTVLSSCWTGEGSIAEGCCTVEVSGPRRELPEAVDWHTPRVDRKAERHFISDL